MRHLQNKMHINDWSAIQTLFDKLNKQLEKSMKVRLVICTWLASCVAASNLRKRESLMAVLAEVRRALAPCFAR